MNDNESNAKIYTELLDRHGDSYLSLGWGSEQGQFTRFKVLSEIEIKNGESILDVGCGISHFYRYLTSVGLDVEYTGIDITPAMVERSAKLFPECEFMLGDILTLPILPEKYDYIIANGIFLFREEEPEQYMFDTIEKMYSVAKRGIAFSCLSDWADAKAPDEFHADPIKTLDFCRRLSRYVALRHDYHPGDFIMQVKKNEG